MQHTKSLSTSEVCRLLPRRDAQGHKGSFGHVLSICGSEQYHGAAVLAALGALRCGAGLVTCAFPRQAYAPIAAKLSEAPLLPLPGNRQGTLHVSALPALRRAAQGKTAVLLGCGLGLNADTKELTQALLAELPCPLVLDADGINAVAAHMHSLGKNSRACALPILTPHPGEVARLTGCSPEEIQHNRVEIARQFADTWDCVLVLKGAETVIAAGGHETYLNPTGNAGLAKGGSGDLLAGMIVSLLSQGMPPFEAALCGVYLHGMAADRTAQRLSQRGMSPLDCADELKGMLSLFEQG